MTAFRRKPVYHDIDITVMREMRERGMRNKEIAAACGCSAATVSNYIGPKKPRTTHYQKITESMVVEAEKMRKDRFTWREIAEYLGCGMETIRARVVKRQAMNTPAPAHAAEPPEEAPTAPTLMDRLNREIAEGMRTPPPGYTPPAAPDEQKPAPSRFKVRQSRVILDGGLATYDVDFTGGTVVIDGVFTGTPVTAGDLREIIVELQDVLAMLESGQVEGGGPGDGL